MYLELMLIYTYIRHGRIATLYADIASARVYKGKRDCKMKAQVSELSPRQKETSPILAKYPGNNLR
jgi:hypothetical protein